MICEKKSLKPRRKANIDICSDFKNKHSASFVLVCSRNTITTTLSHSLMFHYYVMYSKYMLAIAHSYIVYANRSAVVYKNENKNGSRMPEGIFVCAVVHSANLTKQPTRRPNIVFFFCFCLQTEISCILNIFSAYIL